MQLKRFLATFSGKVQKKALARIEDACCWVSVSDEFDELNNRGML